MKSLIVLFALLSSVSTFAAKSGSDSSCERLLTVTFADSGPNGRTIREKADSLVGKSRQHTIKRMDGLRKAVIVTSNPDQLLKRAGQTSKYDVTAVHDGQVELPLFQPKPQYRPKQNKGVALANQARREFYTALGLLPEGRYELKDEKTGEKSVMFVKTKRDTGDYHYTRSFALIVEIWPGSSYEPQTETKHKEKLLASFDNRSGLADGVGISLNLEAEKPNMTLSWSLPYGYGDDRLEFFFDKNGSVKTIRNYGTTYKMMSFRAIREVKP